MGATATVAVRPVVWLFDVDVGAVVGVPDVALNPEGIGANEIEGKNIARMERTNEREVATGSDVALRGWPSSLSAAITDSGQSRVLARSPFETLTDTSLSAKQ